MAGAKGLVRERLLVGAEDTVDGRTNAGCPSLRCRDRSGVANSTAPPASERPSSRLGVVTVAPLGCGMQTILFDAVALLLVERPISSLSTVLIVVSCASIGPPLDVLAERPEEVRSELPNDSSVLRATPGSDPKHGTDDGAKEEEDKSEEDGPKDVGGAEMVKGGRGRGGVKGGVGVASDGAILLVESRLPDRQSEGVLNVDGL